MKSPGYFTLFIAVMLMVSGIAIAVQVDGYCYLENQQNHEGTKVLFQADSPSAVTDSTYTDSTGYYQIDLAQGVYDILFIQDEYYEHQMSDMLLFANTTLPEVTLIRQGIPISGALSGVLERETYLVTGDITVQEGATLVIDSGAIFNFESGNQFTIYGYLLAIGTENDSIKFRRAPGSSRWGGISFADSADDDSRLEYCLVTGGGANNNSAIQIQQCSPTIVHCRISDNVINTGRGGGIRIGFHANPLVSDCTILDNHAGGGTDGKGGGIYCSNNSSPVISHCIITENTATSNGGGIFCTGGNPVIRHCIITGNSSNINGGGVRIYSGSAIIDHCTICGNSADTNGGGISLLNTESTLSNTIVKSNLGNAGIDFDNSVNSMVQHCDFYNNAGGNFSGNTPNYLGLIITINNNGDSCDAYFNIFLNPQFISTTGDSAYYLSEISPCIDAGDPNSPIDPDWSITDIGAKYFHQQLVNLYPRELDFGQITVTDSSEQSIWIKNSMDSLVVIHNVVTIDSAFRTDFSYVDSMLIPGDSLEVTVTFTPCDMITYSDTLLVFTSMDTLQATLAGVGIASLIESVPDSLIYVPLELGMDTSLTIIFQNSGTDTLNISNVVITDTAFIVDFPTYGNPIPPSGASDTCQVIFDPDYEGLYMDSLVILCNAFNAVNDTFIVNIWGECGIVPDTVRNLVIEVDYPDAVLNWDHVTNTIYGSPLVVDYYLVYFKEVLSETFNFLAVMPDTTYTHSYVAQFSASMFYMVEGYVGELGGLDEILASGRRLTREEVHGLLDWGN